MSALGTPPDTGRGPAHGPLGEASGEASAVPPRCYALVPCAGVGLRVGTALPKQYALLAGLALVAHTLTALKAVTALSATLVVLSQDDSYFERMVPADIQDRAWLARCGGMTRARTVANGLEALRDRGARSHDWVLVHDAARCLVRPAAVERLMAACLGDAVGGLLALPVSDTLKRAGADNSRALKTVAREGLWAAQTPQMFRLGVLAAALAQAGPQVTDEASAVEAQGLQPLLVMGEWDNLKVTWPADLALAEQLLALRAAPSATV
jgi:2-C-methyl-D-erythritol 4-phosphate cytidylyltransferase